MSRAAFAAVVIGTFLVGAAFIVAALLVLSGAVTVAGLGEGTLAQRIVAAALAFALGGLVLASAGLRLAEGRKRNRPAESAQAMRSGPFRAGVGSPEDRHDGSLTHPGVGEF